MKLCTHFEASHDVTASAAGCEACLRIGSSWVHLRVCLTCGAVGCCDDSPNRHATRHAHDTGHPTIASLEPGEHWGWCYPHELFVERLPPAIRVRRTR